MELYALFIAAAVWAPKLKNNQVKVHCDNEAVVHMVNNSASSCAQCMVLIRHLVLLELEHNFRMYTQHIRSEDNDVADCLSRLKFELFKKLSRKYHLKTFLSSYHPVSGQ